MNAVIGSVTFQFICGDAKDIVAIICFCWPFSILLIKCVVKDFYSACSYTPLGCLSFLDLHNVLAYLNMHTQNITYNRCYLSGINMLHSIFKVRHNIPCHVTDVSCGKPCGKQLSCGHKCAKICHKVHVCSWLLLRIIVNSNTINYLYLTFESLTLVTWVIQYCAKVRIADFDKIHKFLGFSTKNGETLFTAKVRTRKFNKFCHCPLF